MCFNRGFTPINSRVRHSNISAVRLRQSHIIRSQQRAAAAFHKILSSESMKANWEIQVKPHQLLVLSVSLLLSGLPFSVSARCLVCSLRFFSYLGWCRVRPLLALVDCLCWARKDMAWLEGPVRSPATFWCNTIPMLYHAEMMSFSSWSCLARLFS